MAKKQNRSAGRPSEFTEAIAKEICEQMACGKSLIRICKAEGMPGVSTVYAWLLRDPKFQDNYARAKKLQADYYFDEMVDISDDDSQDTIVKKNKDGSEYEAVNAEFVARSRLRIETRKWVAGRLRPKKYGDYMTPKGGGASAADVADALAVLADRLPG